MSNDQEFLNAELASAHESDDASAEKTVLLHYQQAALQNLQRLEHLCETDAARDFSLLSKRAKKLMDTTENYLASVAVLPQERIQALFAESKTLLGSVGELCSECQQRLQQRILATFRELRQPPSSSS